nr:hypothetical protein [Tanacetum cinerariifolium]
LVVLRALVVGHPAGHVGRVAQGLLLHVGQGVEVVPHAVLRHHAASGWKGHFQLPAHADGEVERAFDEAAHRGRVEEVLGVEKRPQHRHYLKIISNENGGQRLNNICFDLAINNVVHKPAVDGPHQKARRFGLREYQVDKVLIFIDPVGRDGGVAEGAAELLGGVVVAAGREVAGHGGGIVA